jgi:hypothetical protein
MTGFRDHDEDAASQDAASPVAAVVSAFPLARSTPKWLRRRGRVVREAIATGSERENENIDSM